MLPRHFISKVSVLVAPLVCATRLFAEVNGICCGQWVTLSEDGFGFARDWNCEEHLIQAPEEVVNRVCHQLLKKGPEGICPALQPVCDGSLADSLYVKSLCSQFLEQARKGIQDESGNHRPGSVAYTKFGVHALWDYNGPLNISDDGCYELRVTITTWRPNWNTEVISTDWARQTSSNCQQSVKEWREKVLEHETRHQEDATRIVGQAPKPFVMKVCGRGQDNAAINAAIYEWVEKEIIGEPASAVGDCSTATLLEKAYCESVEAFHKQEGGDVPFDCSNCQ